MPESISAAVTLDAPPLVRETHPGAHISGRQQATRFLHNVLAMLSGQVLTWLATSLIVVALPRYLGDANLGKLTFAWGFTGIFAVFLSFGAPTWLVREIARDRTSAPHLAFNALVSRLPFIAVGVVAVVVLMQLMRYPASTQQVVYIAFAWTVVSACSAVLGGVLQGLERMALQSAIGVIERVAIVIVGVGSLVFLGAGLNEWSLVVLGGAMLTFAVLMIYFWRVAGLSFRIDAPLMRRISAGGVPFLAWSIATTIYGGIDVTMLSLLSEDKVVGWYGAAYRFVGVPSVLAFALTTAMLPAVARSKSAHTDTMTSRVLEASFLVTLPIALLLLVGAAPIIHFLHWSQSFDHSIVLLQILAVHVPLVSVTMVIGTVLIAENREKAWLVIALVAAIVNPLMNLAAIPLSEHYANNGAIGAAVVTVVTEVIVAAGAFWLVGIRRFGRRTAVVCMRALAAGAVALVAMLLAVPYGLVPLGIAGAGTYVAAVFLFRAVRVEDLRELTSLALHREGAAL